MEEDVLLCKDISVVECEKIQCVAVQYIELIHSDCLENFLRVIKKQKKKKLCMAPCKPALLNGLPCLNN